MSTFRVGEASHPGPASVELGLFNPSGLTSKLDVTAHLPGDVWIASETMLTAHGVHKLRHGLKALKSPYQWLVPGAPCASRTTSQVGVHAGVLLLSKFPARSIPHSFDADSFAQSRIQVAGVCIGGAWLQVGMLYGFPNGLTHQSPAFQTDSILEQLVDRIAVNSTGLRIIAGDMNHEPHELSQLQRLRSLGFREAQDVALYSWGQPVESTSRGFRRLDQIWLSPEAIALLRAVSVDHEAWPDHSSAQITLDATCMTSAISQWRLPQAFSWPKHWDADVSFECSGDSTKAYADLWRTLEQQAASVQTSQGVYVHSSQLGRAQTLNTRKVKQLPAPRRSSRAGEAKPMFFGPSVTYNRWFKQLRRLQALVRARKPKAEPTLRSATNVEKTWQAICNAAGFHNGFAAFWISQGCAPSFHEGFPSLCPPAQVVEAMFESFQCVFRTFGRKLASARYQGAKHKRLNDLKHVFADCKAQQIPAVDTLLQRTEVEIEEVRHEDLSVVLRSPVALDLDKPVVIGGQPCPAIAHCEDQVWLETLEGVAVGQSVSQETMHLTDAEIMEQFRLTWEPRWKKLDRLIPSQWDQIIGFCKSVMRPIDWHFEPWTSARVGSIVRAKKPKAAIGADGVSHADLAALPPKGRQAFADMFSAIEHGMAWPGQLTTGFVSSLAKIEQPGCADDYRPITVYPLPYRVWSSGRSKEALLALSKVLPQSIQGGLPGRHPKVIWYELALTIEWAHAHNSPLQGLVVDLRKAFNTVPRLPIWQALELLGFPSGIARAWASFVCGQARRFKVRHSVSDPIFSCTGYPEGCGLSVFAFALLDWMLDFWAHASRCDLQLRSFVDDWHLTFPDVRQSVAVWDCLLAFAGALDLQIDPSKSYAWAAEGKDRLLLREGPLSVQLCARALGAHHNFCWRKGNNTFVLRIKGMKQTWTRLRLSLSPYKYKLIALGVMAWPRALHGVSVVPLGLSHFQTLRSGAMRGLKADRIGANPILHLSTTSWHGDPELWAIIQTIKDAREFGGADKIGSMLAWFVSVPEGLPSNGPSAVLHSRLCRLGWRVETNGLVSDQFGCFDLFNAPWEEVLFRVRLAWPTVMELVVQHRPSLHGLARADIGELHKQLNSYGAVDQVYLRCHLDGTVYTAQCRSKFREVSDRRPFCTEAKDTFFHRAWECPALASVRPVIPSHVQQIIRNAPACLSCHGWPVRPPEEDDLIRALLAIPLVDCPSELPCGLVSGVLDFFIDGTASMGEDAKLRLGAWSVTAAGTIAGGLWDNLLLCAGHVVGVVQTSFRAELEAMRMAVLIAVKHQRRVRIWSDCMSVVRGMRKILEGRLSWKVNQPHAVVWRDIQLLVRQVPDSWIEVVKVVSHGGLEAATTEVERWSYFHNELADAAASGANIRRPAAFKQVWQACFEALRLQREAQALVLEVHLRTARESDRRERVKLPQPRIMPGDAEVPEVRGPDSWPYPSRLEKKYGVANVTHIHTRWTGVGAPALKSRGPLIWVSGTSLFLDFLATMCVEGPFVHKLKWYDSSTSLPADCGQTFVDRTRGFLLLLRMYLKEVSVALPTKMAKPHSSALCFWVVCYRLRWSMERLEYLDNHMFQLFGRQLTVPTQLQQLQPTCFPAGWQLDVWVGETHHWPLAAVVLNENHDRENHDIFLI